MRFTLLMVLFLSSLFSCHQKEKTNSKESYLTTEATTLSPPIVEGSHLFFTDSVEISMKFALTEATIKYTLNGSEVGNTSASYKNPFYVKNTTLVKAKSFHPEYVTSSTSELKVVKTNKKLKGSKIVLNQIPNERYSGKGILNLTDHIKGTSAFANDNAWLGFQADSIQIDIELPKKEQLSKITISSLLNHGAWIFLPKKITVLSNNKIIGNTLLKTPKQEDKSRLEFIDIAIKKEPYSNLKIVINALDQIPEWHQGKGTLPWFFIDEILAE